MLVDIWYLILKPKSANTDNIVHPYSEVIISVNPDPYHFVNKLHKLSFSYTGLHYVSKNVSCCYSVPLKLLISWY